MLPWLARIAPVAAIAVLIGLTSQALGVWLAAAAAVLVCAAYVWQVRPLLADLATEPRFAVWLRRVKLVASPPSIAMPAAAINERAADCR